MKFHFLRGLCVLLITSTATQAQTQPPFISNLPIMLIDTSSPIQDEPKITASLKIIDNASGSNASTDTDFSFNGIIGIELRGSTSQDFPKKPYGFEVRDESGNGIDVSLLGMPAKDDWILNATYNDKALMRDVLAYKLGRDQGRYASRSRYCELMLNGSYQGIYILLEKIKRDKNRVPIPKLDPAAASGDALTGGYIIKVDKTTAGDGEGWTSVPPPTGSSVFFQYEYPKTEDITDVQKDYIIGATQKFEHALLAGTYQDPVNGYGKYMDIPSMVDFMIMNEVTKNVDGYRLSTFMYKQKDSNGGKFFMGPIWDFNLGFGNANYCTNGNTEGFVTDFNTICPTDGFQIPFWWYRVQNDSTFKRTLGKRWSELRAGVFQTSRILTYIDSVSTVLGANGALTRNFQSWPVLGQYVWPNYYVGNSYAEEVTWLKNWVTARMNWLDKNIPYVISGIRDDPHTFSITAFPNPFDLDLVIEVSLLEPGTIEMSLYDAMGNKIETRTESHERAGTYKSSFSLPLGRSGVYILRARSGGSVRVEKLVRR